MRSKKNYKIVLSLGAFILLATIIVEPNIIKNLGEIIGRPECLFRHFLF